MYLIKFPHRQVNDAAKRSGSSATGAIAFTSRCAWCPTSSCRRGQGSWHKETCCYGSVRVIEKRRYTVTLTTRVRGQFPYPAESYRIRHFQQFVINLHSVFKFKLARVQVKLVLSINLVYAAFVTPPRVGHVEFTCCWAAALMENAVAAPRSPQD